MNEDYRKMISDSQFIITWNKIISDAAASTKDREWQRFLMTQLI